MQPHISTLGGAIVIISTLLPIITSSYEIAFHPFWLAVQGENLHPLTYNVFPRFTCNLIPLDDLEPDTNHFIQNVVVRTAEDAAGPPKVILFYDTRPPLKGLTRPTGPSSPCTFRNAVAAAYFWPEKPSTQVFYVQNNSRFTHFKEIDEGMPEWGRLVRGLEMEPGEMGYFEEGEWGKAYDEEVELHDFDWDEGYSSGLEYSFRGGVGDDDKSQSTDVGEVHSGDEWDIEFEGPYWNPSGELGPEWKPREPFGTRWAPGQVVPDWEVYRPDFRDWRNWRIGLGDYRPLAEEFTEDYSFAELKKMGYMIDEEKEALMRGRMEEVQRNARSTEQENARIRAMERESRDLEFAREAQFLQDLMGMQPEPAAMVTPLDVLLNFNPEEPLNPAMLGYTEQPGQGGSGAATGMEPEPEEENGSAMQEEY
ncbi:hypothetical protein AA313_de0200841 [Arthrobotrys entomopaga]|nr:hypothetical protein AA313_de0200841 [Arthrobotrys entomopaga]